MNKKLLTISFFALFSITALNFLQAEKLDTSSWMVAYQEPFTEVREGDLPEDFFILDGHFEVIKMEGNKCLKLIGKPVGEHGFLYGPRLSTDSFEISFSCLGAVKSRRHNVFAGSLGGIRGYIFRINPVSEKLSLYYDEAKISDVSLSAWTSNDWMSVNLRITGDSKKSKCDILVSKQDDLDQKEIKAELLFEDKIKHGRFALWGFAYAEQDIYWDNLVIRVPHLNDGKK